MVKSRFGVLSSPSKDESDVTLRHRTATSAGNPKPHEWIDTSAHFQEYMRRSSDRSTLRRRTILRLNDPSYLQGVRRASQRIAEAAWSAHLQQVSGGEIPSAASILGQQINGRGGRENALHHPVESNAESVYFDALHSDSSVQSDGGHSSRLSSTERAALRGTKRALHEAEDVVGGGGEEPFYGGSTSEFDLDTIDESIRGRPKSTSPSAFLRMRTLLRGGPGRRVVRFMTGSPPSSSNRAATSFADGASHRSAEATTAAWMCGVCGMVFSTEHSAEKHEREHIADVVAGMEWMPKTHSSSDSFLYHRPMTAAQAKNVPSSSILLRPNGSTVEVENVPTTPKQRSNGVHSPSSMHAVGNATPNVDTVRFRLSSEEENGEVLGFSKKGDDEYPGLEADLPHTELPKCRTHSNNEVRFADDSSVHHETNSLLLRGDDRIVLADEALCDVVSRAVPKILTYGECDAERELALLARDKAYYDELSKRAVARRVNPSNRFRSDGEDLLAKVQNKFLDAYQLMKESDGKKGVSDQYNRIKKSGEESVQTITHSDHTLYVNVMVKNSVKVVRHELERLAKQRWEVATAEDESLTKFERFRVYTQIHVVKLAGLALASDFTPRRIAVQLSNDLYRLLTPKLMRRGVTIETEIEYRVGPYFVLAVNIKTIDWWKLIKTTRKDTLLRQARWEKERRKTGHVDRGGKVKAAFSRSRWNFLQGYFTLSNFDMIERTLALLYFVHWSIYLPICWFFYYLVMGPALRHFILATVADEIFYYVEEKGMEMEIKICRTDTQAAFMLSALREIRLDGQEWKKKIEQSESREKGLVLGPLMGPAIAADKLAAPPIPEGFDVPENLEYIGLELSLPVGFQRLRWALLSKRSQFVTDALYKTEARYENIVMGEWDKFPENIGEPKLPDGVDPKDFVGAEKEGEYLMPKSAFVSANMCYETHYILAYNDYCFCLKKRARNPDAPFGKTFLAWTQYLVINTGNDTCKLTCSVQPEFPHGTPMVSRQITSGMRAGTGELFVLIGSTIEKYSDEFP